MYLRTFELSDYRRRLETAIVLGSTHESATAVRAVLQARLRDVLAEQDDRTRIALACMSPPRDRQLTPGELDRYANQLARCLKALDTRAPIRRASSMSWPRSAPGQASQPPAALQRRRSGRRRAEANQARACGKPGPGAAGLTRPRADPGTDGRHRRRACRAGHTSHLNDAGILIRDARHDHLRHIPSTARAVRPAGQRRVISILKLSSLCL